DFHVTGVQTCALPIYRQEDEGAEHLEQEPGREDVVPVVPVVGGVGGAGVVDVFSHGEDDAYYVRVELREAHPAPRRTRHEIRYISGKRKIQITSTMCQ